MLWFIKIKINIYNTFILDTSILIENMSWSMFVLKAFVELIIIHINIFGKHVQNIFSFLMI